MKRQPRSSTSLSVLCSALLALSPHGVMAEPGTLPPTGQELAAVIITEVQTGNAARGDEFIELHNTSSAPVDLSGWQLRYITSSVTSTKNVADPSTIIKLLPPVAGGQPTLLTPGGYYLLYAGAVVLPTGVSGQQFEAVLPATGGSLVLLSPDDAVCELVVEDALAWGSTTHLFGEGEALVAGSASASDRLHQRYVTAAGAYVDSADNADDFGAAAAATTPSSATPGAANTQLAPEVPIPGSGVLSGSLPATVANPDCTLPPGEEPPAETPPPTESPPSVIEPPAEEPDETPSPTIPPANRGLKAPLLSEFLPNPASPQTDKQDEFIELYNPNAAPFDLSGYVVEVGLKTKRRYIIPDGVRLAPRVFLAFFSADSGLALSNSGSQVTLLDPLQRVLATSEVYGTAKDGQAWVLADGKWQWTTKPTPNALNIVSAPPAKQSRKKSAVAASVTRSSGVNGASSGGGSVEEGEAVAAVADTKPTPLHPGVLALIAGSALLYGAYEYRHDLTNKLYQFRSHRAARRAARQSPEGR